MIEKFKKFISDKIYNQLCYYKTIEFKSYGMKFFLTAYEDDFEYVKRQICHFIASWDAAIYIIEMDPDDHDFVIEIREAL